MKQLKYAVIGAGNGGQTMAGYLSAKGYRVSLFDFLEAPIQKIKEGGNVIKITGALEMESKLELASNNMEEVVRGADVIFVVNPSTYHIKIAKECAKYLEDGQVVFLNPGSTFGSFAFKKALDDAGCTKDIILAESNTLLFACRMISPGLVEIGGKKDRIIVAAFPATKNDFVKGLLEEALPEVQMGDNVFVTSLDNTNPLVHPGPTMMNCNWAESGNRFLYYHDGIGETMGEFIERMDKERIRMGLALGLELGKNLFDMFMQYEEEYETKGETLSNIFKNVKAYDTIYAVNNVRTRYIYEDVPTALIPLIELGRLLNCPVDSLKLVADMCCGILNEDFWNFEETRSLEKLGLDGMTVGDLIEYANTGVKKKA
ncbi:NAD/NADP octopine/nopaline dehydrogenase family protein [Anaerovorax sp. IOR16]|uniref:NAD/NADP octopine/nopaline dehydrogenase family protein n=1 Tax=Anaerovorax sp. IOR16 TaxID=2773458 RepID=UPI0019D2CEBC|nr:NAD/NADP octopine/nopaline dehydrogenase family protein [Anaerovorax sp. IOR16]